MLVKDGKNIWRAKENPDLMIGRWHGQHYLVLVGHTIIGDFATFREARKFVGIYLREPPESKLLRNILARRNEETMQ